MGEGCNATCTRERSAFISAFSSSVRTGTFGALFFFFGDIALKYSQYYPCAHSFVIVDDPFTTSNSSRNHLAMASQKTAAQKCVENLAGFCRPPFHACDVPEGLCERRPASICNKTPPQPISSFCGRPRVFVHSPVECAETSLVHVKPATN